MVVVVVVVVVVGGGGGDDGGGRLVRLVGRRGKRTPQRRHRKPIRSLHPSQRLTPGRSAVEGEEVVLYCRLRPLAGRGVAGIVEVVVEGEGRR